MALTSVYINLCVSAFLLAITGSSPLSITEFVVPRAVKLNETVDLECNHSLQDGETEQSVIVKWWWKPLTDDEGDKHLIYQRIGKGRPLTAHLHNVAIKDNDAIELLNVSPANSGTYECEVTNNKYDEYKQSEQLMVFSEGTGPTMNLTILDDEEDDDDKAALFVTCLAEDVAPEPELVISVKSQPGLSLNVSQELSDPEDGTYDVNASVQIPTELLDDDDTEFSCELFFKDKQISHPVYKADLTYTTGNVEITDEVIEGVTLNSDEAGPTPQIGGAVRNTHSGITIFVAFISFHLLVYIYECN